MAGQNADANAGELVINQDRLGASSATDSPIHSRDTENVIPTVEFDDNKAGGKGAEGADKDADAKGGEEDGDRFDKHPRFQELNERMKAAEERALKLEAKLEVFEKGKGSEGEEKGDADDGYKPLFTYEDVSKWSDDEIREKLEDGPKAFITNLFAQVVDETRKVILQEQAQNAQKSTISKTFEAFAKENPGDPDVGLKGFDEMWKSGELRSYMGKNPGHNAMSAYYAMTQEAREKSIAAKSEARIKAEAEKKAEEARKNKEAKAGAKVLGAGPGGAPAADRNADLKETKAKGGLTNVLAQRLKEMRAQK